MKLPAPWCAGIPSAPWCRESSRPGKSFFCSSLANPAEDVTRCPRSHAVGVTGKAPAIHVQSPFFRTARPNFLYKQRINPPDPHRIFRSHRGPVIPFL